MDKQPQKKIDARIVKENKATGMNTPGGEYGSQAADNIAPPRYKGMKGITVHDDGPDTWKVGQGSKG